MSTCDIETYFSAITGTTMFKFANLVFTPSHCDCQWLLRLGRRLWVSDKQAPYPYCLSSGRAGPCSAEYEEIPADRLDYIIYCNCHRYLELKPAASFVGPFGYDLYHAQICSTCFQTGRWCLSPRTAQTQHHHFLSSTRARQPIWSS